MMTTFHQLLDDTEKDFLFKSFYSHHFLQMALCCPLQVKSVINLLFAAYTGDVSALRRWGGINA